jgi:murein hydrolase activator
LLGVIERFARNPPHPVAVGAETPVDRSRSLLLLDAAIPALRAEAHALAGEFERVAALRTEIAANEEELAAAREVLAKDRERLAQLTQRRDELDRRMLPADPGSAARIAKLGHDAEDIGDLIERADAATDRRDKELLAHARAALPKGPKADPRALTTEPADPTRPPGLRPFDPPHSVLSMPVSGSINRRFRAADAATPGGGTASQGLGLAALPGAEAVAPFDGRVVYAGPFGKFGLVLIIRHGGLYHSLLGGLGRIDVTVDQWVLAGEPVGAMPDGVDKTAATLYVELRHDGRPVDPQPWLAPRDEGRDEADGDQKVRE